VSSNYAFKPIAEQALRSNQTVVPQRLNAALGLMKISVLLKSVLALVSIPLIAGAQEFTGTWERRGENESGMWLKSREESGIVKFQLEISRGAPSYNSGFLEGEFVLKGAGGVFSSKEVGNCEISFRFDSARVVLEESKYGGECGFGYGVHAHGELELRSHSSPEFADGDPRAGNIESED